MSRVLLVAATLIAATASPLWACSVCGGDPQSELTKGAISGVLVMIGVTYGLLMGFVALGATWFIRARRLSRIEAAERTADGE